MDVYYQVSVEKKFVCDNVDEMCKIVKELDKYTDGWYCSIKSIEQNFDEYDNMIGTYTIILECSIETGNKEQLSELFSMCTKHLP